MEDIRKHHRRLASVYKRPKNAEAIVRSAKALARLILSSEELLRTHKRQMLTQVLWLISNADGKYATRYRTQEVVRLATENPGSETKIQHEHVHPRRQMIDEMLQRQKELLASPDRLDELLDRTVGCVVTEDEHKLLTNEKCGWHRYKAADVVVLDMSHSPPRIHDGD